MKTVSKKDLNTRMNKISGQVRAVTRMIQEDRDAVDILVQINAARSALYKVAEIVYKNDLDDSGMEEKEKERFARLLERFASI